MPSHVSAVLPVFLQNVRGVLQNKKTTHFKDFLFFSQNFQQKSFTTEKNVPFFTQVNPIKCQKQDLLQNPKHIVKMIFLGGKLIMGSQELIHVHFIWINDASFARGHSEFVFV